ncbi:MAG: FlgD immunoglobulin-like domain containing protein [Ignavibacteria bacterium]
MKNIFHFLFVLFVFLINMQNLKAVEANQWDNFEEGTTLGWGSGGPNPNPPVNISGGGPNGDDDNFLQVTSTGGSGPGSMFITFNTSRWTGDYIAAGVTVISMHIKNFGTTDLLLRLAFMGSGGNFWTINAEPIPANSGWVTANFSIQTMDLTGGNNVNNTLNNVTQLRILHSATGGYQGDPIVAQLGIDNITAAPQPLPVELISFTAALIDGNVLLNWETASENNNRGFEIERKITNKSAAGQWHAVGFKEGQGTSAEKHTYSFIDNINNISSTEISYRLKQIDLNGEFSYSSTVFIVFSPNEFLLNQNYPNPFNPSTQISFRTKNSADVELKIFDELGNEVKTLLNENMTAGFYSVNWNGENNSGIQVSSGTYFYRLSAADFTSVKKMILLR